MNQKSAKATTQSAHPHTLHQKLLRTAASTSQRPSSSDEHAVPSDFQRPQAQSRSNDSGACIGCSHFSRISSVYLHGCYLDKRISDVQTTLFHCPLLIAFAAIQHHLADTVQQTICLSCYSFQGTKFSTDCSGPARPPGAIAYTAVMPYQTVVSQTCTALG